MLAGPHFRLARCMYTRKRDALCVRADRCTNMQTRVNADDNLDLTLTLAPNRITREHSWLRFVRAIVSRAARSSESAWSRDALGLKQPESMTYYRVNTHICCGQAGELSPRGTNSSHAGQ